MITIAKIWDKKVVRFACMGACNTLLDLTILNLLVLLAGLPELLANTISVCISITVSFFLNRRFVFRTHHEEGKSVMKQFLQFFLVTGISVLILQNIVIFALMQVLGQHDIGVHGVLGAVGLAKVGMQAINLNVAKLSAVLVGMVWNFVLYNFVIFKKGEMELDESIID